MDITDRKIEASEIELQSKLEEYTQLLDYRYKNMLVKAEPEQLLPVEVEKPGSGMVNIEEVASMGITADDQFTIIAKDPVMLPNIQKAIFKVQPLIIQELNTLNFDDDEEMVMMNQALEKALGHKPEPMQSLILTMPPMTKERRDFVKKTVETLRDLCKLKFLESLNESKLMLSARVVVLEPDRVDEGCDKLQAKHDEKWKVVEDKTAEFLKAIEERYEAYKASLPQEEAVTEMSQEDRIHSGMSFKLGQYEE